jgi:hypothetical protein
MVTILRAYLFAGLCAVVCGQANACSTSVPPPTRYVGNTATDNQCTDNDIQSAINNAVCPGAKIVITGEHTYTAQHLTLQDKSLVLIGSTGACGAPGGTIGGGGTPTAPVRTISGTGHTGDSVITIKGNSNVALQFLEITGGAENDSGSHGGGIYFNGTGSLTLDTDTIDNNFAYYGAGIYFNGSHANGADATLFLRNNVEILSNTAQYSGGGVFIEGYAQMRMLTSLSSTIALNTARGVNPANNDPTEGYGGGIRVIGPAGVIIGSPGALIGAIAFNNAVRGGGIAVDGGQGDPSYGYALVLSTSPSQPTSIDSNSASVAGGGIYLKQVNGSSHEGTATSCLYNFRLTNNSAADGAAIYADFDTALGIDDYGSEIFINNDDWRGDGNLCGLDSQQSLGGVSCAAGVPCNDISGNVAQDSDSHATNGAVILVGKGSYLDATRFSLSRNTAGSATQFDGAGDIAAGNRMRTCLITDNQFSGNLIYSRDGSRWSMDSCTIANNTVGTAKMISADSSITMTNSILYQLGKQWFDYSGDSSGLVTNYILTNDRTGYLHAGTVSLGNPLFVDPVNSTIDKRDYHLLAFELNGSFSRSPALDIAPAAGGTDLEGNAYDQDVLIFPNTAGPRDLGAYEMTPLPTVTDRIFEDGFGDPLSLVR